MFNNVNLAFKLPDASQKSTICKFNPNITAMAIFAREIFPWLCK